MDFNGCFYKKEIYKLNNRLLNDYLEHNYGFFSNETQRAYRVAISQFIKFSNKNINEIKPQDIRAWLVDMEKKGLKPRTINLKLTAVRSFFKYCTSENKLINNPSIKVRVPKLDDSLPCYLSKQQLVQLQELTKDNERERAIIEILYTTGLRVSEMLNIKLSDIKWETLEIFIRNGKGSKSRFVLFTYDCAERLKDYLTPRKFKSDYLFASPRGGPLSRCLIEKSFRSYSKQLGFKVTPHTLRHTFATHLCVKNMSFVYIQELLGHSNINSTRIYTRLNDNARKKLYDKYQK